MISTADYKAAACARKPGSIVNRADATPRKTQLLQTQLSGYFQSGPCRPRSLFLWPSALNPSSPSSWRPWRPAFAGRHSAASARRRLGGSSFPRVERVQCPAGIRLHIGQTRANMLPVEQAERRHTGRPQPEKQHRADRPLRLDAIKDDDSNRSIGRCCLSTGDAT